MQGWKHRLHSVQSGRDVPHHGHEEEWYLEYRVLKEMESIYDALVPSDLGHIHE
jgi:hypothetical protein